MIRLRHAIAIGGVVFLIGCAGERPTSPSALGPGLTGGAGVVASTSPDSAGNGATQTIDTPLSAPVWDDCSGEWVVFSGTVHLVVHVVDASSGGFHVNVSGNWQDTKGVGQTSGRRYRATSAGPAISFHTFAGATLTERFKFQWIGQGSVPNLQLTSAFHITVSANRVVTAEFTDLDIVCS